MSTSLVRQTLAWSIQRYPVLSPGLPLLIAITLVLAFFALGSAPLFDVDEGAFAEASREMLASGDWLHTTLQGADRFDKPMLAYWMQVLMQHVLGPTPLAARLGSALCLIAWVGSVVVFARRYFGWSHAWLAGLMLITSSGPLLIGRAATADALLNLLLTLTLFDLWRALERDNPVPLRRAAVWAAMGMLTKGPVALLIPGAVCALMWLLVPKMRKSVQAAWSDPWAWCLLIVLALPWYAYAFIRHGDAFIDGFFMRHNLSRFQAPMEGHRGGWGYYLVMLPVLLMPWGGLLALTARSALRSWWRKTRPVLVSAWSMLSSTWAAWQRTPRKPHPVAPGRRWATSQQIDAGGLAAMSAAGLPDARAPVSGRPDVEPEAVDRLPLLVYLGSWAGFVLVFFSLSGTKLPHYLLYGITPIILGVAFCAMRCAVQQVVLSSFLGGWLWISVMLGFMAGLPLLAESTDWIRDPMLRTWLVHAPHGVANAMALLAGTAMSGCLMLALMWVALRTWPRCTFGAALGRTRGLALYAMLALVPVQLYLVVVVVPWVAQVQQGPVQELAAQLRGQLAPDDVVVMPDLNVPSFAFALQRETPRRAPRPGEYAVVRAAGHYHHPGQPVIAQAPGLVVIRVAK